MKPIRNITTALSLAALALTGCNNEEMTDGNALPEGAVHITATIDGLQTRATIDASTGAGTFEQGDVWGLYTTIDGTSSENKEYKYQETRLLWGDLSTTKPVTFSAHYPRITGTIANPTEYDFPCSNQDLLSATATASKGEEVDLIFKHLMHRLVVNLTKGEGVDGELADATITTDDLKSTVKVNLITGTVNPETATGSVKETGTGATLDCIVVPQDLTAGGDWIIIRMNNNQDVYTYKVPSSLKEDPNAPNPLRLESGKKLTLNLTLKKTGATTEVELTSSEISGWGNGGTIEDDVTIGGDTPTGEIDMADKTVDEVKAAIQAALDAGTTELKLTGPIANSGIGGMFTGTFGQNTTVTKIDLTEVTGWEAVNYWGDAIQVDAVIGLPAYAFWGCTSLTEIKLPAEVKAIGTAACSGCTALTAINLGEVTHIGWSAFEKCGTLASVDLAKATTLYGKAFAESGLTAVTLPVATAVSVGSTTDPTTGSFFTCAQLTSIQAPNLKNTGNGTFANCKELTTVDMPALKGIGEAAFSSCTSLTEMNLSAATTVGVRAFIGCTALETLNLPAATVFNNYLVSGCSSLKEIKVTAAGTIGSTDETSLDEMSVFDNMMGSQTQFDASSCVLTLNPDKQPGNSGSPAVKDGNSWANATWQSITYTE